jgi:hypothetical protein
VFLTTCGHPGTSRVEAGPGEHLLNTSCDVRPKYVVFHWWSLRDEIEARGGGDAVASFEAPAMSRRFCVDTPKRNVTQMRCLAARVQQSG